MTDSHKRACGFKNIRIGVERAFVGYYESVLEGNHERLKCPHHLVQDLVLATALTSCNKLPSNDLGGPEALRTAHRIGLENNR